MPSPKLPKGVTIRTPAASPTVPAAVLEWSTLSAAEDITMFGVTARFSSQSASKHPSNQISKSADRELWAESYDLRGVSAPKTDDLFKHSLESYACFLQL